VQSAEKATFRKNTSPPPLAELDACFCWFIWDSLTLRRRKQRFAKRLSTELHGVLSLHKLILIIIYVTASNVVLGTSSLSGDANLFRCITRLSQTDWEQGATPRFIYFNLMRALRGIYLTFVTLNYVVWFSLTNVVISFSRTLPTPNITDTRTL
jgi:hypothetical protein